MMLRSCTPSRLLRRNTVTVAAVTAAATVSVSNAVSGSSVGMLSLVKYRLQLHCALLTNTAARFLCVRCSYYHSTTAVLTTV
jgi:hypothetical protein